MMTTRIRMAEQDMEKKKRDSKLESALFIPAGLFLGFGIGFLIDKNTTILYAIPAGMYIGFGVGFTLFAIVLVFKK